MADGYEGGPPSDSFEFRNYRRGGPGWRLDWFGGTVTARAVEAAKRGIDEVTEIAVHLAKTEHPWENRTGQTEEAVYRKPADYDFYKEQVWGLWGIRVETRDANVYWGRIIPRERFNEQRGRPLNTQDVAMFLEFGTVRMEARPWLYPVWDQTQPMIFPAIKAWYDRLGANFRYRRPDIGLPGAGFISLSQRYGGA